MKNLFFLLALFSLLLVGSCNLFPSDPELPAITMEGNNTFGCLVDGKLFLNEGSVGFGSGTEAEIYVNDTITSVNIYAGNPSIKNTFFLSVLDSKIKLDTDYNLSDTTCCGIYYTNYSAIPTCDYNKAISGTIRLLKFNITGANKIVAGTFEFTATSIDCNTTIVVSKGRFDIGDVN